MKAKEEQFPFIPEVRLFHDKKKCRRFMRKHFDGEREFMGDEFAQTWYERGVAVILFPFDRDWHGDAALLCHEAYHAIMRHFEYLGEDAPGEEFVAYGIQSISKSLFEAHEKWKAKRRRTNLRGRKYQHAD